MDPSLDRLTKALSDRYTVEREIGRGGMAIVYLAEDLKHHRRVAVKVFNPELSAVVGTDRFLAEIQTTANLQHPNILPLFDSGEADGLLYYVMPYVEGESLRAKLDREKQLPIDEAVRIATDVAEALQAAHDQGVIHRDIKPANILLSRGRPLVADFGIALAVSAAGGGRLTETGLSLGTPHYMSPEQASADRDPSMASDVYSLGCVLYEMLTGEPPFPGNTAQSVLVKILTGDAMRPTEHRKAVPANVEGALLKAIEKIPADRFPTTKDFAEALANPGFRHATGVPAAAAVSPSFWKPLAIGVSTVGFVLALVVTWLILPPESAKPVQWFSLQQGGIGFNYATKLTPDGLGMIYTAPGEDRIDQLWLRRWNTLRPVPISGTTGAFVGSLSPDGTEVAYVTADAQLVVTQIQGGVPRTLCDSARDEPRWGNDGFIYFSATSWGLSRVADQGGPIEVLTEPQKGTEFHFMTDVHPEWDIAIFSVWQGQEEHWIDALRLSNRERRRVTKGENGHLTSSGHLVFATSEGDLVAAPFDPELMEMGSPAVLVAEDIHVDNIGNPYFSLSENGSLLYWTGLSSRRGYELVWVTRSGEASPVDSGWIFDPHRPNVGWALSPDEGRIAVKAVTDLGPDIWVKELPNGPLRRLTFHEAEDRFPRWAPDGQNIMFLSDRLGNMDIWTRRAVGIGEATLILDFEEPIHEVSWSPDGEWIVFRAGGVSGVEGSRDIFRFRPSLDSLPQPLLATEADETGPTLSPDGGWLAYVSTETGRREVFLSPFPETQMWKVQVSAEGGRGPTWGGSSGELFYVADGGTTISSRELSVATIDPGSPPAVADRQVLFTLPEGFYFANNTTSYAVTDDGQLFLMARVHQPLNAPERELILVQNWVELMKERVGR